MIFDETDKPPSLEDYIEATQLATAYLEIIQGQTKH